MNRRILIGIDVGGTFTHAVAVEQPGNKVIAHAVTPTTHTARISVSEGIVKVFRDVVAQTAASDDEIMFVAHSTTQATNAMLEGDVAKVGIFAVGKGLEALKSRLDTKIGDLELSQGKFLKTVHLFSSSAESEFTEENINSSIDSLINEGCEVIVAAEAFSVDNPENERLISKLAAAKGIPATATFEISQLYGLKVRTRTAAINASILPKMTETALLTNQSIKDSGITAPLMIMRSDGGVMDLEQMKKRPILTMLSGPAAGIAAALMYVRISDGIFLEVGGTSTDISAIKNGKAMSKSASVGGYLTYLKTLDSRTVGIGGGSMIRMNSTSVEDVGPRSAHIANLGYIAFTDESELQDFHPELIQPREGDPDDYLVVVNDKGKKFALTLTDASIFMGMTTAGDYAYGNEKLVRKVFSKVAESYKLEPEDLARAIMDKAISKVRPVVEDLLEEYEIDRHVVSLVGGGGGATAVVNWLGRQMNMTHVIAPKAEVISSIGAALAMLRDSIERTVVNPTEKDITSIKNDAIARLEGMGASPDTIEVQIEIDKSLNILRATATGAFSMNTNSAQEIILDDNELIEKAAQSFHCSKEEVQKVASTSMLDVFSHAESVRKFGIFRKNSICYRVLEKSGVVKLQIQNGAVFSSTADSIESLFGFIEKEAVYNDVGMVVPEVFLLFRNRICDYSTIIDYSQLKDVIRIEIADLPSTEQVVLLINRRK